MSREPLARRWIWLPRIIITYGIFLGLLLALNVSGADRWWLGAFNLYLPQAVWLTPVLLLAIPTIRFARRWTWVLVLYGVWVCGPLMGFCWSWHNGPDASVAGARLRFMTCNIKNGQRDAVALLSDISRYEPDVVFLQDAGEVMKGPLKTYFKGWNISSYGQYVIASRWPLGKGEVRPIAQPSDEEHLLRTVLQFGDTPITLYNVHLLTPRGGFSAFRHARKRPGIIPEAVQDLQENVKRRILQAGQVAALIQQESGLVILAGDLNSPDDSLECRALRRAGLHDAFAEGGRGYGYTYGHFLLRGRLPWLPGASWLRIDHILVSSRIRAQRCWTGTGAASDHRPVYADLVVSAP